MSIGYPSQWLSVSGVEMVVFHHTVESFYGLTIRCSMLSSIGVARIFDWGGAQILKNSAVFTEIESDFSAEIGNSGDFSAQNQVISKKKRSSPKLREVLRPKPLALLLLYCLITVMCAITEKKMQLNIVRLCCHNFLSLLEF